MSNLIDTLILKFKMAKEMYGLKFLVAAGFIALILLSTLLPIISWILGAAVFVGLCVFVMYLVDDDVARKVDDIISSLKKTNS